MVELGTYMVLYHERDNCSRDRHDQCNIRPLDGAGRRLSLESTRRAMRIVGRLLVSRDPGKGAGNATITTRGRTLVVVLYRLGRTCLNGRSIAGESLAAAAAHCALYAVVCGRKADVSA